MEAENDRTNAAPTLAHSSATPYTPPTVIESAMETGSGADDEPEMTLGDKHMGEPPVDPDGDGVLTLEEANTLLGGKSDDLPGQSGQ